MNETKGDAPAIRVIVADDQAIVRDGLVTVLSLLNDIDVVAEAEDGEQAVRLVNELQPDVVLMDLRMPRMGGAEATTHICTEHPETAVLVLTTFADDESIASALQAGARGYLTKDAGRAELAAAIRAVAEGQTTLAPEVGQRLIGAALRGGGVAGGGTPVAPNGPGLPGAVGYSDQHSAHPGVPTQFCSPGTAAAGVSASLAGDSGSSRPDTNRARWGLTARESEVLELVAQGLSNPEIAGQLFLGVSTVKTHINAIFTKMAVETRAQAVAKALS